VADVVHDSHPGASFLRAHCHVCRWQAAQAA
jgi:hypothetical protein